MSWRIIMQAGSYELLLALADECHQDTAIRDVTSQLLNFMPTFPNVSLMLTRALLEQQSVEDLSTLWTKSACDGQPSMVLAASLQYTIQVCPASPDDMLPMSKPAITL